MNLSKNGFTTSLVLTLNGIIHSVELTTSLREGEKPEINAM